MAGLAANKSKGGQAPPSGYRPQRSLSRRVSFNESTLKQSPQSSVLDVESQRNTSPSRSSGCNICCAWTSIIIGTLFVIILVVGAVAFSFFQSNMPDFHFQGLDVINLSIFTKSSADATSSLSADIFVSLNTTNHNDKMAVYYSAITADLSSQEISLGKVHLPEMEQNPQNSTELKLHAQLINVTVPDADAKEFRKRTLVRQLLIDVVLGGNVHYVINGQKMPGFPFKVLCHVYQGDVDDGDTPKCYVKMTPLRG